MSKEAEIRVCKNKKCQKVLPAGYKHKYCEACRNKHAETAKNVLKGLGLELRLLLSLLLSWLQVERLTQRNSEGEKEICGL